MMRNRRRAAYAAVSWALALLAKVSSVLAFVATFGIALKAVLLLLYFFSPWGRPANLGPPWNTAAWVLLAVDVAVQWFLDGHQNTARNLVRIYLLRTRGPTYDKETYRDYWSAVMSDAVGCLMPIWIAAGVAWFGLMLFSIGWQVPVAIWAVLTFGLWWWPLPYRLHMKLIKQHICHSLWSPGNSDIRRIGLEAAWAIDDLLAEGLEQGEDPQKWWRREFHHAQARAAGTHPDASGDTSAGKGGDYAQTQAGRAGRSGTFIPYDEMLARVEAGDLLMGVEPAMARRFYTDLSDSERQQLVGDPQATQGRTVYRLWMVQSAALVTAFVAAGFAFRWWAALAIPAPLILHLIWLGRASIGRPSYFPSFVLLAVAWGLAFHYRHNGTALIVLLASAPLPHLLSRLVYRTAAEYVGRLAKEDPRAYEFLADRPWGQKAVFFKDARIGEIVG